MLTFFLKSSFFKITPPCNTSSGNQRNEFWDRFVSQIVINWIGRIVASYSQADVSTNDVPTLAPIQKLLHCWRGNSRTFQCPFSLTEFSHFLYIQHIRKFGTIQGREEKVSRLVSQCRTRVEMSKRFVNPALLAPLCLVFLLSLIWQLSIPALAQTQPHGSSVSAPKSIVLLYSYDVAMLAYQQATRGFLSIMEEGQVSEKSLFFGYLDLERKKDKMHYKNLVTLLLHKYATKKIDLIVIVHGPALKFLLNEGRDLSPGTPALSYLGPDTIETAGIERRLVLLPMNLDIRGTLKLAFFCQGPGNSLFVDIEGFRSGGGLPSDESVKN